MWGTGGEYYWGRKDASREGVVVVFAWMFSQARQLKSYIDLYSSFNWNCLICHSRFLNLFFPEKAENLALDVLNELVKELQISPCPVVLSAFSGGPKACLYKVFQIIEGKCEVKLNSERCRLVRNCIAGNIYDSSPVDFVSDLGKRLVLHPSVLNMPQPPRILSWIASGISTGLDALFLERFESQRAEYWQALYASVYLRAPYLFLCSENDDLAPYQVISNFANRLRELGANVKVVTMNGSPHVGHYRVHPVDYKAAVRELLGKAAVTYSQRIQKREGENMGLEGTQDEISKPISEFRKFSDTNQSFRGISIAPIDHFVLPLAAEYYESPDGGSVQDHGNGNLISLPRQPSTDTDGVLGQILFDVCLPRNVEDWDIKSSSSKRQYISYTRRHSPFNPVKCILRSRL